MFVIVNKKAAADREIRKEWIKQNPGPWNCYLNISPMCLGYLDESTMVLDHVIPKGRGNKYRYDLNNLKPSCVFCNGLKGSRTIESLSKDYPHLKNPDNECYSD